jgi:hypothetical protein
METLAAHGKPVKDRDFTRDCINKYLSRPSRGSIQMISRALKLARLPYIIGRNCSEEGPLSYGKYFEVNMVQIGQD